MPLVAVSRYTLRACARGGLRRFWRDLVGGKTHCSLAKSKMIGVPDTSFFENDIPYGGRMLDHPPRLVVVEGNIGVGKSTLAKKLAAELRYNLYTEPTSENPYLGGYSDVWSLRALA